MSTSKTKYLIGKEFVIHRADPAAFINSYATGHLPAGPWRCGSREYYEVSATQLAGLGGLEVLVVTSQIIRLDKTLKDWEKEDYWIDGEFFGPMRHRIMSWRNFAITQFIPQIKASRVPFQNSTTNFTLKGKMRKKKQFKSQLK